MPGSTPATSQLDWLSSTTAMIVLSWSKATRDLLKSFSWGIGALRQLFASDDGAISSPPAPYHLSAGGSGPPTNDQAKKSGSITPRDTVVAQCLQGKRSTVLALSRTLCAGSAGAAAFAATSLTAAARGALPGGRSGRRDGRFRSNKGMGTGCSRAGDLANLVGGVEQRLLFEQGA